MLIKHLVTAVILFTSAVTWAQTNPEGQGFKGESELGTTLTSGNSKTESVNGKTNNTYSQDKNNYTAYGRYLRTKDRDVESARNWEAGVRYERVLTDLLGVFIGHKAESDPYSGYVQRDSSDLGLKYLVTKTETFTWSSEAGYRYSKTHTITDNKYESFGRLYTEATQALNKGSYVKLWLEYLPNFTNADAYQANGEASLMVLLSDVLSLKMGYLVRYQNSPPTVGAEKTDTTFITAIMAKY